MTPYEPDIASGIEQVRVDGAHLLAYPAGRHAERLRAPARVAVCVPVWNGGGNLARCLDGVAAQTFADTDIVIVDNVSTDGTFARAAAFAATHPRTTVYQNPVNVGRIGNWNRCLALAEGVYVKLAMVNDILAPDCVERLAAALDAHPSAAVAASAVSIRNPDGSMDGGAIFPTTTLLPGRAGIEYGLRVHNVAGGPSGQMLRTAALTGEAARFDETFSWAADWELTMRLFLHGDLVYVPSPLSVLDLTAAGRFHTSALSADQFRDECRVTAGAVAGLGSEVSDELAAAALARIDRLYAKRGCDAALSPDRERAHQAVGARSSWEDAGRRVFTAVLDRWDGWQPLVSAYVAEFGGSEPVSLALVAGSGAGVDPERMYADVAAHLAGLGRDPETIPDLSLAAAPPTAPAAPEAEWLELAGRLSEPELRERLRHAAAA